jgi:hypothetical protein
MTFFVVLFIHIFFIYCDQAVLDMQLYEKGLDVFEDDPATSVSYYRSHSYNVACFSVSYDHLPMVLWFQGILHKHLLRSMGSPIVDKVLITLVILCSFSCTCDFQKVRNSKTVSVLFIVLLLRCYVCSTYYILLMWNDLSCG